MTYGSGRTASLGGVGLLVLFVSSDRASWIMGQVLAVRGSPIA